MTIEGKHPRESVPKLGSSGYEMSLTRNDKKVTQNDELWDKRLVDAFGYCRTNIKLVLFKTDGDSVNTL
jgi:hypothetical protein